MIKSDNLGIGVIVAGIVGPLALVPGMLFVWLPTYLTSDGDSSSFAHFASVYFITVVTALTVAYPITLIFGMPLAYILGKNGKLNLLTIVICGLAPVLLMFLFVFEQNLATLIVFGGPSIIVAVSCWAVLVSTTKYLDNK